MVWGSCPSRCCHAFIYLLYFFSVLWQPLAAFKPFLSSTSPAGAIPCSWGKKGKGRVCEGHAGGQCDCYSVSTLLGAAVSRGGPSGSTGRPKKQGCQVHTDGPSQWLHPSYATPFPTRPPWALSLMLFRKSVKTELFRQAFN